MKMPAGAVGPAAHVAAGFDDSLVVTASGQLYAFGNNEYGQLGTSAGSGASGPNDVPLLVGLPAGTTVDTVFSGPTSYSTFAVVADLAISTGPVSQGRAHSAYTAQPRATGGEAPYKWTATGLPPGLSIAGGKWENLGQAQDQRDLRRHRDRHRPFRHPGVGALEADHKGCSGHAQALARPFNWRLRPPISSQGHGPGVPRPGAGQLRGRGEPVGRTGANKWN